LISLFDPTRARATELIAPAIDYYDQHAPALRHRLLAGWSVVLTAIVVLVILAQSFWAGIVWLLPRLAALLQRTGEALAAADRWLQDEDPGHDPVLASIAEQLPAIDEPAEPLVTAAPVKPARATRRTRSKGPARG
jgi:hypothetical protein